MYTMYNNNNHLIVATVTNGKVFFFQKGFASNEEAKASLIEEKTKRELEKHPNLSPSLAREFAECELNGTWGEWD